MDQSHLNQAKKSARRPPNALQKGLGIWWSVGPAAERVRRQLTLVRPLGLLTKEVRSTKRKWQSLRRRTLWYAISRRSMEARCKCYSFGPW